jgi:hypothetical protein
MKRMLILLCLFAGFAANAKEKETLISSEIQKVTVYQQGAQVTRTGKGTVPTGTSLLVFKKLNPSLNGSQIRFNGKGEFTVLSTSYKYKTDTIAGWDIAKKQKDYQAQRAKLQAEVTREQGWLSIYDREEQMLQANQIFGSKEDGIAISKLKEAAEFIRERFLDIRTNRLAIQDRMAALQTQMAEIDVAVSKLTGIKTVTELQFYVRVNAKKQTTGEFSLTYQTSGAGWYPGYDAHVNSVNEPLDLTYNAFVYQNSGEDWDNVEVTVSTGQPQQKSMKPNLSPWYVNNPVQIQQNYNTTNGDYNAQLRQQPYNGNIRTISGRVTDQFGTPLIGATVAISGTNNGAVADVYGNYSLSIPQGYSQIQYSYIGYTNVILNVSSPNMNVILTNGGLMLDEIEITSSKKDRMTKSLDVALADTDAYYAPVTVQYTPTQTQFKIDAKYNIPSDGTHHAVKIQDIDVDANFIYQCAPKLDPKAYLTARITDWQDFNLLDGDMNIYFEDSYVGKTSLRLTSVEDTLNLSLGADPGIEVRRKRIKADHKKQIIGSTQKDTREWEIEVRNNKREEIRIQIEDQIPVTSSETVEIDSEMSSGSRLDETTGRVTWELTIGSGKSKDMKLKYEVRYPKGQYIRLE